MLLTIGGIALGLVAYKLLRKCTVGRRCWGEGLILPIGLIVLGIITQQSVLCGIGSGYACCVTYHLWKHRNYSK